PLVKIDTSAGLPSELCWLSVSPDDSFVYATNFGYSYVTSFQIYGNGLEIASDPACPRVKGDGTFRALNNTVSSGPSDSWMTPDGAYLYQIYANASSLVGYATQADGSLDEVTRVSIPYNSPQGLVGVEGSTDAHRGSGGAADRDVGLGAHAEPARDRKAGHLPGRRAGPAPPHTWAQAELPGVDRANCGGAARGGSRRPVRRRDR